MKEITALQIVVKTEMTRQGMSWSHLAEEFGVQVPTVHERVGLSVPTMDTINKLADAFGLHSDDICEAMLEELRLAERDGRRLRGDGNIQGVGRP